MLRRRILFEFEKIVIATTEYLQEASARLDLDAACGQLWLPTVCIAEVRIFEKRLPGGNAKLKMQSRIYR